MQGLILQAKIDRERESLIPSGLFLGDVLNLQREGNQRVELIFPIIYTLEKVSLVVS